MTAADLHAVDFYDLWDRQRPGGWAGSDGTWSVRHPTWDATLFVNGDTALLRPHEAPERRFPHHTFVVYSHELGFLNMAPLADATIHAEREGEWYWGGELVWDGPDLFMFATRLAQSPSGWGFRQVGRDLVRVCWPVHDVPAHVDVVGTYDADGSWGDVDWGSGVCVRGRWTLVLGVYAEPDWPSRWVFGNRVYAARAPRGQLDRRYAWEYLTDDGWRKDFNGPPSHDQLRPIIPETAGPAGSFSLDYDTEVGRWLLVSKKHGDLGSEVTVWATDGLDRPWTSRRLFDSPWSSANMSYGARAHLDLPRTPEGRVLVSVNHNRGGAALDDFYREPWFYRPSWHEVDL